jgi:hypothetical protein
MKDSDLRGIVLKYLYENQREDVLLFGAIHLARMLAHSAVRPRPKTKKGVVSGQRGHVARSVRHFGRRRR